MVPEHYLIIPDKALRFQFDANWEIAQYRNDSLYDRDGDKRSDLIATLAFSMSQTLIEDPNAGNLVLRAIIHWTDAQSNVTTQDQVAPFSYDKVVYGIQLAWSW